VLVIQTILQPRDELQLHGTVIVDVQAHLKLQQACVKRVLVRMWTGERTLNGILTAVSLVLVSQSVRYRMALMSQQVLLY